ncbi:MULTISPECIES: phage baseplate plug family protein [Caproicibacterium]|uniref:Cyanophage baseplate Pam3 plug gp18 domain-containing protein n=1 Tax=Caproicibacterium argilliputei TaxID=3030016 RepID=A0AA97H2T6_9FIRM|nr:hypothetical protein [Caproicibacterium argilliputei]WOC33060.1 hypothetical protein PXC00_04050 [Caproicibacterium argilliputei]
MRDRIEIDKDLIPYQFDITLAGQPFTVSVDYNRGVDLFTVSLYDSTGALLCAGEPLIYGSPLFRDVYRAGKFPVIDLVPLDESGHESAVTWDNFGKTVFLTIDDEGD